MIVNRKREKVLSMGNWKKDGIPWYFPLGTKTTIKYYWKGKYNFDKKFEYRSTAEHYTMYKSPERYKHAEKMFQSKNVLYLTNETTTVQQVRFIWLTHVVKWG